jgi:hypothetical protein
MHAMFQRFAKDRTKSRDVAYRELHKSLSENADILVAANILELPKLVEMLTKLEEFIQNTSSGHEKTPVEAISEWLTTPLSELKPS